MRSNFCEKSARHTGMEYLLSTLCLFLLESRLMLIDCYEHHHAFGRDCNASEGLEQGHCYL